MKKGKLNYRFHNPNPPAVTVDYILKTFFEANAGKVEAAVKKAVDDLPEGNEELNRCQGHSA